MAMRRLQEYYGSNLFIILNKLEAGFNFELFKAALDDEFAYRKKKEELKRKREGKDPKENAKGNSPFGSIGNLVGLHSWQGLFGTIIVFLLIFMAFGSRLINTGSMLK